MPVLLSRMNRRDFLFRAASGVAVLSLPLRALAARGADRDCFALLSDIHVAADPAKILRETNMTERLQRAAADLVSMKTAPAAVIISGDLALNQGERGDYQQMRKLLEPIRQANIPLCLALGNHDHRENFWGEIPEASATARPLPASHVAIIPSRHANWFVLDSLEKTLATPGRLGHEQLQWLGERLDAHARKPAIVVVHHNPGVADNISGLKDTVELLDVIRPRRQVKALVFGHTHRWSIEHDPSGIHLVNLPPVAYTFRNVDPAGWVEARLTRDGIAMTLKPLGPSHGAHNQTTRLSWRG